MFRIEGKWSDQLTLTNLRTGESEVIWEKRPYHEKYAYMHGFTPFMVQLNYFPKRLQKVVAPTDTRRRPDQRAMENGELKFANTEKLRLEEKQRSVRRYNEKHNIKHKCYYFDVWENPEDPTLTYYRYNGKYFEQDRA